MAYYPGRKRNPSSLSLKKTLAIIKAARKTATDNNQIEGWLECYRKNFEDGRKLALEAQDPPGSDSEDELCRFNSPQRLKGADAVQGGSFVLKLSPEVFYEIFSYVGFQDLLSLSRACKRFRGVLLSISTKSLWQRAIRRVKGLPPCPKDLSEPQYASLIYSETCSECGKPVLVRMDTHLHVKLCAECQSQLLEAYSAHQRVHSFVPASELIYASPQEDIVLVLKRDVNKLIQEAAALKASDPNVNLDSLGNARAKALHNYFENEMKLHDFICQMLEDRAANAKTVRRRRRRQIEQRLLQSVWTSRDMHFSKGLLESWEQLVNRKRAIDDQVWVKLYPKLETLLRTNKAHKEQKAWDGRRNQRHEFLIDCLSNLEGSSSPVLVETTTKGFQSNVAETMYRSRDWGRDDLSKVNTPFPTAASALNIPIIRNLVEKDITGSEMGHDFDKLRDLIIQYIADWQTQVQQDLVDIWHGGNEPTLVYDQDQPSTTDQTAQHPKRNTPAGTKNRTKPAKRALLPTVQLKFTKADGTTTHNIQELPDNLRLLLRADVVFRTQGSNLPVRRCSYPEIVSGPEPNRYNYSSHDGRSLGDPWDPTAIARDEDASHVARVFLPALQRPNATGAEMRAFGATFKCCRCQHLTPSTWQSLVSHYAEEISRFKEAQERIRELGSTVVYNDTHDIDTKGSWFKIVPLKSREYRSPSRDCGKDAACKVCGGLGIKASYRHVYALTKTEPCPILRHLIDVHGITNPIMNEHFEDPYQGNSEEVSDEDDDDECDTDNSYYGALPTPDELMDVAEEADLLDSDGGCDRDAAMAYFRKKMKRSWY